MNTISKFVFFLSLVLTVGVATAQIVTVPPDLHPGDQYRLILTLDDTATTPNHDHRVTATSSDISFYNTYINQEMDYYPSLAIFSWYTLGSTSAVDARDNTSTNPNTTDPDVPIYSVTGARVADGNADLWDGSIQSFVFDPACRCVDSN